MLMLRDGKAGAVAEFVGRMSGDGAAKGRGFGCSSVGGFSAAQPRMTFKSIAIVLYKWMEIMLSIMLIQSYTAAL